MIAALPAGSEHRRCLLQNPLEFGKPLAIAPESIRSEFGNKYDRNLDRDTKVQRVGPLAPNMNAYAERFVQTLKFECLNHFVICGEKHLQHLVKEFTAHYLEERPHQGRGNVPLSVADPEHPAVLEFPKGTIECRERLGGLLKHSLRVAT